MLRGLKLSLLHASRACGLFRLASRGRRRSEQLLILCYHGISIDDEHEWAPGLFMPAELFESRLEQIRRGGYRVLALSDALTCLYAGTLPPRSVVITFDDGNFDFYARAWPLLEKYDCPATVYLTTYYCEHNVAVFPLALSYVLWKSRQARAELHLSPTRSFAVDTRSPEARRRTEAALLAYALDEGLSAREKDELACSVADVLDVDFDSIRERRMLHIMNPREVRTLASRGVDFQLHTHRHRSPLDEIRYRAELQSNRERIESMTGTTANHFCYPSGTNKTQFEEWLDAEGVLSATTCQPGMASRASHRLHLPRLLDHSTLTSVEFDAWLSGIGARLPHRAIGSQDVDRDGRLVIARAGSASAVAQPAGVAEDGWDNAGSTLDGHAH